MTFEAVKVDCSCQVHHLVRAWSEISLVLVSSLGASLQKNQFLGLYFLRFFYTGFLLHFMGKMKRRYCHTSVYQDGSFIHFMSHYLCSSIIKTNRQARTIRFSVTI